MEERKMKLADNAFPISSEEILRQNQEFRKNGKYSRKIERAVSVSINALEKFKNKKELTKEEEERKAVAKAIIDTWLKYSGNGAKASDKRKIWKGKGYME